jgi:hypothetical protein
MAQEQDGMAGEEGERKERGKTCPASPSSYLHGLRAELSGGKRGVGSGEGGGCGAAAAVPPKSPLGLCFS